MNVDKLTAGKTFSSKDGIILTLNLSQFCDIVFYQAGKNEREKIRLQLFQDHRKFQRANPVWTILTESGGILIDYIKQAATGK